MKGITVLQMKGCYKEEWEQLKLVQKMKGVVRKQSAYHQNLTGIYNLTLFVNLWNETKVIF